MKCESVSQSVSSRPPRAHHTTVSKDGSAPRGQHNSQVLSTRSLGLLNFASEVGLSQHTCDLWCSLPYTTVRDCDRQSGGGWGEGVGGGGGLGFCQPSSYFCLRCLAAAPTVRAGVRAWVHVALLSIMSTIRGPIFFPAIHQPVRRDFRIGYVLCLLLARSRPVAGLVVCGYPVPPSL